nr:hypothetical protein [Eubacterium sp.]
MKKMKTVMLGVLLVLTMILSTVAGGTGVKVYAEGEVMHTVTFDGVPQSVKDGDLVTAPSLKEGMVWKGSIGTFEGG